MTLNFAELGRLERLLISEGSSKDASSELSAINRWLNSGETPDHLHEPLVRLAEIARNAENRRATEIAIGCLAYVRREFENDEARCQAILHFAQQRVDSLENDGVYFANVILAPADESDARALFEAAIGDATYSTRKLIDGAREFVQRHEGENSIFGRLAADLSVLVSIVENPDTNEFADIARAALIYFWETADAIPDDLGLIGRLDDAYVVQQAVDQVRPNRASLTNYLEQRVRRWPFLRSLKFGVAEAPTPISDYLLVNSALLLDVLEPGSRPIVVLLVDVGPLSYLLAFVAALASVSEVVHSDGAVLERGDRLVERDGRFEVVFNRYLREEGESFVICDVQSATHVQVIHPARGKNSETLHTMGVTELGNFRRTAVGVDKRRRSTVKLDVASRKVGALERLFGTTTPIMLDSHSPVVLVVAPLQKTKQLAKNLRLFGAVAADVVPTGHLRRTEDGFDVDYWSKYGIGGEPMLCVVRSIDEAYECVVSPPFKHRRVSTVVAEIRPGSSDAAQLARIADSGVSVLSFVAPGDADTLEVFAKQEAALWSWDQKWFGELFVPKGDDPNENPLVKYEHRLRRRLETVTHVETVAFAELSRIGELLTSMRRAPDSEDNEPLSDWTNRTWWLLLRMCRLLTPMTPNERDSFCGSIEDLSNSLQENRFRWSAKALSDGIEVVKSLTQALTALDEINPKYERLIKLTSSYPRATISVAERDRQRLADVLSGLQVRVSSRWSSIDGEDVHIIPAWYGRSCMNSVAFSSSAERRILLFYPLEAEWFDRSKQRREHTLAETDGMVNRNPAIPITERRRPAEGSTILTIQERFDDVDEVLRDSIYRFVDTERRKVSERSDARIVGFVGGAWAAFTSAHRIVTVSHLIDVGGDGTDVISTVVADLQIGDIVLLLRESDRDALRERAHRTLSIETIRAADLWKRVLGEYVESNPNLEELRQKLARADCPRSLQTISNWISNKHVIGPAHAANTLLAIAEATGSSETTRGTRDLRISYRRCSWRSHHGRQMVSKSCY